VSRSLGFRSRSTCASGYRIDTGLERWRSAQTQPLIRTPHSHPAPRRASATTTATIPITPRSGIWFLPPRCWCGPDISSRVAPLLGLARTGSRYLLLGALLGASLWYVARRLYGNEGGFIALTLYCFSPGLIRATPSGQPSPRSEPSGEHSAQSSPESQSLIRSMLRERSCSGTGDASVAWHFTRPGGGLAILTDHHGADRAGLHAIPGATRRGAVVVIWTAGCALALGILFAAYFFSRPNSGKASATPPGWASPGPPLPWPAPTTAAGAAGPELPGADPRCSGRLDQLRGLATSPLFRQHCAPADGCDLPRPRLSRPRTNQGLGFQLWRCPSCLSLSQGSAPTCLNRSIAVWRWPAPSASWPPTPSGA